PISIMATFALMYQTDITLNIMSLGGIALGVGMLVDNSIVVLESVHRHKKADGSLADGVYRGTQEVGRAVTASTLTTVAVFVPLVFVEGIAGQLFKDQALAITYSLVVSLLVALTFIPMVLALGVKRQAIQSPSESSPAVTDLRGKTVLRVLQHVSRLATTAGRATGRFIFVDLVQVVLTDLRRLLRAVGRQTLKIISPVLNPLGSGFDALNHAYPRALTWSLNNKPVVLAVAVGLVGFSAVAYQRLGAELIPPLAQGEFSFEIKLPEGKPLEQTDGIINDIETRIKDFPGVDTVFSSVGGSNKNQFASGALEENFGRLYVVMKDRRDKLLEQRTINRIREELRRHPEVTYTFSRPTLFSFKTPIEVEIYAFDIEDQRTTAGLVAARLERIDGLSDIQSTTQLGNPEIQVRFDRERLARLRLDESEVANILRNKIRGDVASRYREGDKQIEILVRAEASDRSTIADIKNLIINQLGNTDPGQQGDRRASRSRAQNTVSRTPSRNGEGNQDRRRGPTGQIPQQEVERGVPIRLAAIADVVVARGPSEIRRIRSQRAAVVSANLAGRDLSSVSREIRAELQQLRGKIPVNTVIGLGGQNQEMESSYRSLLFALGLAIFLVYLVMASQFESLVHPFVILFTVPLAVVGVILSLFVTATTLSVMVFLGVIILAGIVVNNAIVLIDYTNQLRHKGLSKRQALLEAGQIRLRPIVMTTLTTVLGLFPMALGWGEGAEVRAPMAITVMGGLLFSTMLTLLLIPVVYELVDRKVYVTADAAVIDTSEESEQGMGEAWLPAVRKEES
ncbi:efflux RND transporter permease subunit, partial [Acidobacteria bacterium AH-259-G07]|nr:efflux RND transporter permease subunit [Acidobacteria bacterium AH-259-G07]